MVLQVNLIPSVSLPTTTTTTPLVFTTKKLAFKIQGNLRRSHDRRQIFYNEQLCIYNSDVSLAKKESFVREICAKFYNIIFTGSKYHLEKVAPVKY